VVGVRELRAHLSAYLRAVRRGETVTIGDRGGPPPPVQRLDEEWPSDAIVDVTDALVRHDSALAERFGLRGFDALHLASGLELRRAGVEVVLLAFDGRLARAPRRARLPTSVD
jgi:hypothetical protein